MKPQERPHGFVGPSGSYLCTHCSFEMAMAADSTWSDFTGPLAPVWSADTPRVCYLCSEPHGPILLTRDDLKRAADAEAARGGPLDPFEDDCDE